MTKKMIQKENPIEIEKWHKSRIYYGIFDFVGFPFGTRRIYCVQGSVWWMGRIFLFQLDFLFK